MSDLLQLPADKEIGMIETGEWAGYTEGEKSNVLLNAGYVQGADGLWTAPAAEEEEAETTYKKTLPDGVTPFEGTPQEYFQLTGERMFAPGEDPADDLGSFRADVGVLRDMGYGDWLDGQIELGNLTIEGATVGSVAQGKVTPASDGYVNINWVDYPAAFDVPVTPKEEPEDVITKALPDGTPFTGTVDEYFDRSGQYPFADSGAEDRILTTVVDDQPWRGTAQQFLEEYGRHIFAEPDWRDEILHTTVNGEPWSGTADAYFDQHGLYIFGEEIDAPIPVPSGIKVADFPELEDAFEDIKIVDDEYWLSPSDSAVYHQLIEIREPAPSTRGEDLGGWMIDGPYENTGVNWPVHARNMVQQAASAMAQDTDSYGGFAAADLSLSAILANAGKDGPQSSLSGTDAGSFNAADGLYVFSRLAAKYLQRNIPVYDTPPEAGNHTGYINFETGEFVPNPAHTP